MSCSKLPLPEIGDKAHQPLNFSFPQREFGKSSVVKRSFQAQWFQRWPCLHYNVNRDQAFCFSCVMAYKNSYLHSTSCLEKSFTSTGFNCWKDAIANFPKHECSQSHKDAVLKTIHSHQYRGMLVKCSVTTQLALRGANDGSVSSSCCQMLGLFSKAGSRIPSEIIYPVYNHL